MSECTNNCSTCNKQGCGERKSLLIAPNKSAKIGKIIAVMSGKGGVGKSFVTSMLASTASKSGLKTAVIDADITGPSIPKSFGFTNGERAVGSENGLIPVETKSGIKVMSINLLLEEETKPVVWRGPVISAVVQQFYTDVLWQENDVMFIDMPPGTGDVPLTVFQSFPVDGIVVVTTPQDLVGMVVEKSLNMANLLKIPIIGIIENMSYYACPECGKKAYIFGKSNVEAIAEKFKVPVLARLPINPEITKMVDMGKVEEIDCKDFEKSLSAIKEFKKNDA
ncbi:MAG: Mrp/NBP35 family ATP-binding protein [Clostridia bacterium]|nr:Mrp/NBP35 family ATP-binding protein [Clostridia bacterium]